jgi:hypothetical protein
MERLRSVGLLGRLRGFNFFGISRRNFARLHRPALPVITATARTVNAQGSPVLTAPASHSPTPSASNLMAVPLAPYVAGIDHGGGGVGSVAGDGWLNRALGVHGRFTAQISGFTDHDIGIVVAALIAFLFRDGR